ncbi:DUF2291 family protein [Testudinibacter sp. P27/CKL/0425]
MRSLKKLRMNLFLVCISFFFIGCEVVELDSTGKPIIPMSAEEAAALANMEPKDIAEKIWDEVIQDAKSSNIDLAQILPIAENDKSYFAMVEGVLENIDERQNLIIKSKERLITVQAGTIVRGNAIRDSLSIISFDQFKNQIQFARLSKELNKKSLENINKPDNTLIGKEIKMLIAFTMKNNQIQDVVPLEIYTR